MTARADGVAVVIPCYQQAQFLPDAIESALAQTEPPAEVIVVDDGSTDDTREVAGRYPVRYIGQENRGVSAARNAGLAASSAPLVVFLDADDRLLPEAIAINRDCLLRHPDAAMAAGICRTVDAAGAPTGYQASFSCPGGDHYDATLRHNHIWPPATAMHRRESVVAAGGWPESLSYFEDVALYLQIARKYPIQCHPAVVCEYRRQPGGLSSNRAAMLDGVAAVLRRQRAHVRANPRYAEALSAGRRQYMARWGGFLADDVREQWHARRWRRVVMGIASLGRNHPRGLVWILGRKFRTLAARGVR
jgi:glycosyltransferase involved in cell wall biosynthesis